MANLFYKDGGVIGGLDRYKVIEHQGHKIGVFGLCE